MPVPMTKRRTISVPFWLPSVGPGNRRPSRLTSKYLVLKRLPFTIPMVPRVEKPGNGVDGSSICCLQRYASLCVSPCNVYLGVLFDSHPFQITVVPFFRRRQLQAKMLIVNLGEVPSGRVSNFSFGRRMVVDSNLPSFTVPTFMSCPVLETT